MNDEDKLDLLRQARRVIYPRVKRTAVSLVVADGSEPDPEMCLKVGAAVMFDKPIVVVVPEHLPVPVNLRRVASAVITGDLQDPVTHMRMNRVIRALIAQDLRTKWKVM